VKAIQIPEYIKQAQGTVTDESAAPSLNFLSFNLNGKFVYKQGSDEKKLGDEVEIVILAGRYWRNRSCQANRLCC